MLQGLSPQALRIRMFNSSGSLLSDNPVSNNTTQVIPLNHLSYGIYILKINYAAGQEEVMKIIY